MERQFDLTEHSGERLLRVGIDTFEDLSCQAHHLTQQCLGFVLCRHVYRKANDIFGPAPVIE